jgi:hypothetical protein
MHCSRARPVIFSFLILFATALTLEAENGARALQNALKERGFYAAQPSGVMDDQTRAALKRFQIREGLNVTGEPDAVTLQALGKAAQTKTVSSQENASVRERSQQVVTSDREFLARVEAMEQRVEKPQRAPQPRRSPSAPPPVAEPPREHNDLRRPTRAPSEESDPVQSESPTAVSQEAVVQFVRGYLEAAQGPSPAAEIAHYAEHVDYFDSGKVTHDFIGKDQARYYKRWPKREFHLLGEPKIERTSSNGATVRFRIAYSLKGPGEKTATGRTEEVMRLHQESGGLRIVGIQERKLE